MGIFSISIFSAAGKIFFGHDLPIFWACLGPILTFFGGHAFFWAWFGISILPFFGGMPKIVFGHPGFWIGLRGEVTDKATEETERFFIFKTKGREKINS